MNAGELRAALAGVDNDAEIIFVAKFEDAQIVTYPESTDYHARENFGFPSFVLRGKMTGSDLAYAAESIGLIELEDEDQYPGV